MSNENQIQNHLHAEWTTLQNQFDSYEKMSLLIKLSHLVTVMVLSSTTTLTLNLIVFSLIFWLLDGIWKTFQFRIEDRLLVLESAIKKQSNETPFQFNQSFLAARPGTVTLLSTYIKNSLRPTVAYPHVVIIAVCLVTWLP